MGRTPSPKRRRSRSKERDRDRRRRRSRDRRDDTRRHSPAPRRPAHHSRDRHSRRSWSRSRSPEEKKQPIVDTRRPVSEADLEGKTPDEQEMMKIMGFCGFDTTKGKKMENNEGGTVHVILKRKYRQYMNRKGGFNRPLDFVA